MKGVLSFLLSAAVIAVALFVAFLLNKAVPQNKPTRFSDPNLQLDWIIDNYQRWGWVADRPKPAPAPCAFAVPYVGPIDHTRAEGEGAHTHKLYHLYTNRLSDYVRSSEVKYPFPPDSGPKPLNLEGLVVVKESYQAIPVENDTPDMDKYYAERDRDRLLNYANGPDHVYKKGPYTGLFVMFKTHQTEGTDDGWVYATVDPKNKVLETGKIQSCMKCHTSELSDHLFGPR